jgi:large subunit ribosomal protein L13
MKTFIPKIDPAIRKWWVVDLEGQTLGRVAVKVATILRGKDKPHFTPHLDTGDHVIAINARSVKITGHNKPDQMAFHYYTGYPGGLRRISFTEHMRSGKPENAFALAVRRMMPKSNLGKKQFAKLHVYPGATHPHAAQKPEKLILK